MNLNAVLLSGHSRPALIRAALVIAAVAAAPGSARAQPEAVLYSFQGGTDGSEPIAGLIFGPDGALYGTTSVGGTSGPGTVFKLALPAKGLAAWTKTVLYNFKGGNGDGALPFAGVIFDQKGALYGTTESGGTSNFGTVFKLTPPAEGQTQWSETVLYNFKGGSDGALASAGLIFDKWLALWHNVRRGRSFGSWHCLQAGAAC
jgi:uncharacterized repeat protein (TIGR03803 family)